MDDNVNGDYMIEWLKEYESANHLDIMFFVVIWSFIMIEYTFWRLAWKR